MPKFAVDHEYVPVSAYFIENFLKDASGLFVKVYLYALNLALKGVESDNAAIAKELDILESDVMQAFSYWKNVGMIIEDSGIIEFCPHPITVEQADIPTAASESPSNGKKSYDNITIAKQMSEDQSLSELILLAQDLLSKPLSQSELESIFWLYDGLGFSTESILLLLDHCISIEKRNIRYIEKVAIAWHEKGITTPDKIMEYLAEEEKKNGTVYRIKKAMGINDRALSNAEEQYISKWYNEYDFDEDVIMYAYELCLLNTTKLSFPYIDKIIERWKSDGIKTKAEAEADTLRHKSNSSQNQKSFNAFSDGFAHDDLERLTRNKN